MAKIGFARPNKLILAMVPVQELISFPFSLSRFSRHPLVVPAFCVPDHVAAKLKDKN